MDVYLCRVFILLTAALTGVGANITCVKDCLQLEQDLGSSGNPSNNPQYCRLASQLIFCLESNKPSCFESSDIQAVDSKVNQVRESYYTNCGLTEADITECKTALSGKCQTQYFTALEHLSTQKYTSYCNSMKSYITCIQGNITANCNNTKVTPEDAVGSKIKTYGSSICKGDNPDFMECYPILNKNCQVMGVNCSTLPTLMDCAENIVCPTAAGKRRVIEQINMTHGAACRQVEAGSLCQQQISVCTAKLTSASKKLMQNDVAGCKSDVQAMITCFGEITGCGDLSSYASAYSNMCVEAGSLCQQQISVCTAKLTSASKKLMQNDVAGCKSDVQAMITCFGEITGCGDYSSFASAKSNMCEETGSSCQQQLSACTINATSARMKLMQNDVAGCKSDVQAMLTCFGEITGCGDYVSSYASGFSNMCDMTGSSTSTPNLPGAEFLSVCPEFSKCLTLFRPDSSNATRRHNNENMQAMQTICGAIDTFLTCANTTLGTCGVVYRTTYNFADLIEGIHAGCTAGTQTSMIECSAYTQCIQDVMSPVLPATEFYCGYVKSIATCVKYTSETCGLGDDVDLNTNVGKALSQLNSRCPSQDVFIPACPAASQCTSYLSSGFKSILGMCQKLPRYLTCMNSKASVCKLQDLQSYSFADLSSGLTELCTAITSNQAIGVCPTFKACLKLVGFEQFGKRHTDPKLLCQLLTKTAVCAAWNTHLCLPNHDAARNSFDKIMHKWYAKCPKLTLPAPPCPSAMVCLEPLSYFRNYDGKGIVNICPKMKPAMTCLNKEMDSCKITLASQYGFDEMANKFEEICSVLTDTTNNLTNCRAFDSCIRQIKLPHLKDPTSVFLDPRYWCGVVRDTATCVYKSTSGCNLSTKSALITQTANIVNAMNEKCPIDGFRKLGKKHQPGAAPSIYSTVPVFSALICSFLVTQM